MYYFSSSTCNLKNKTIWVVNRSMSVFILTLLIYKCLKYNLWKSNIYSFLILLLLLSLFMIHVVLDNITTCVVFQLFDLSKHSNELHVIWSKQAFDWAVMHMHTAATSSYLLFLPKYTSCGCPVAACTQKTCIQYNYMLKNWFGMTQGKMIVNYNMR